MHWARLPTKLKVYIVAIAGLAIPITAWASWDLFDTPHSTEWIVLAVLAAATVPFFLLLPSVSTIVGIGDAYIMAIAMMYGKSPCLIATLCHTLSASLLVPNRPKIYAHRVIFNASSMVCGAWLYSSIYGFLNPTLSTKPGDIIFPALALACCFFLCNSVVTSTAIAWASGERVIGFWIKNCLPFAVDFSVSSVCATLIVSLYEINRYIPLAVAPLVGVVWGWNKINKAKAMDAERHLKDQEQLYLRTVESLALAVDAKDQITYGHIHRVRAYAMGLAKLCEIADKNELMAIETGSLLHDIGKLAISDFILNKPGGLSKEEFERMKVHAAAGDEILKQIQFPFPVSKYVRCHHERWDGLGYPDGLKGEEIPVGARILVIADAFDAMRSWRPYKLPVAKEDSIEILRSHSGSIYDPKLVQLLLDHIDELDSAAEEASKNAPELSFRKTFEAASGAPATTYQSSLRQAPTTSISAELMLLSEFCSSLGRHLDLADILPILTRRIERLLPFSTCLFFLDNGKGWVAAAHVGGMSADALQNLRLSLGKGISGWVAAYRQPSVNVNPALEFQGIQGDFSCLKDALVVPMMSDGECIGTISLYARHSGFYSQSHLNLLQTVANQAAPLIADARRRGSISGSEDLMDPVTQTHRIVHLSVVGPQLIDFAENNRSPLSLLCIDIKNLNRMRNLYGAATGDSILRKIAEGLRGSLRESDILVRYGQQGFVALLSSVRADQASNLALRLQQQIKSTAVSYVSGHNVFVSVQIAAATYPTDGSTIFALLQSAEQRLAAEAKSASIGPAEAEKNLLDFTPRT